MKLSTNFSLKKHNTFGLAAVANHFVEVETQNELIEFLKNSPLKKDLKLVLGGGSNMLLTKNIDGTVLHVNLQGVCIKEDAKNYVIVEANAGENWHKLVLWAIANNFGGIENLSLIPGNVGTAPIQNIGAYGVELKDVFYSLDAVEIDTGKIVSFTNNECNFGYRESVFKNEAKGKFIITAVRLKLSKPPHQTQINYGAIAQELANKSVKNPTIKDVSEAVIDIRKSKLPDPAEIGNSGSFFKNPIVAEELANKLSEQFPDMPVYPATKGHKKIAAGWLIEQTGWKGYRKGDAGVHKNQALVLVNYGEATGEEILLLANTIIDSVDKKFGIKLIAEVNLI